VLPICIAVYRYIFYARMREIVHIQAGQCGNQIGAKVGFIIPAYWPLRAL